MGMRNLSKRLLVVVAALAACCLVLVSACSQGSSQDTSSATSDGAAGGASAPAGAAAAPGEAPEPAGGSDLGSASGGQPQDKAPAQRGSAQGESANAALLVDGSALVKTGSVALESTDVGRVLTRVYGIVGGVGGDISREDTSTDSHGVETRSLLVLRVPVDSFDRTLDELAGLGHLVSKTRMSKDVTTQVADVDSRVRSAQQSIVTVRRLFSRAHDLGDIIRLESELSQREANLEALQAEQRALADKTTLSTITMTVELPPPPVKPKPAPKKEEASGFLAGLHQGWDALTAALVAVGHGIGVVLPIGTVVLLVVGLVLWGVRRWVPTPRHPPTTPDTSS